MSCTHCGAPRDAGDAACTSCGASLERHTAKAGYALLLAAVLLELVPGSHGGRYMSFGWHATKLGHFWDVAFLALAAAGLAVRATKSSLDRPALHATAAALTAAQAYLLLDWSLVPLLVLAAAVALGRDAYRNGTATAARNAVAERLDLRHPTSSGVALCLAALAVSQLPGKPTSLLGGAVVLGSSVTGRGWTVALVAAGIAALVADRQSNPNPWLTGGATLLFAAWAFVVFDLSLVPLLWLAGAAVATYGEYARAKQRTGGALTLRRLTAGPRRLVLAGVPVCLVALSFTWTHVSSGGYFMGGYGTRYSSYYGGYVSDYDVTKYYMPGFSYAGSGLRLRFGVVAVVLLLGLLVAAVWTSDEPVPNAAYLAPAAAVAVLAVWTLAHLGDGIGPWTFLPGLALLGAAALTVARPTVRTMTAHPA